MSEDRFAAMPITNTLYGTDHPSKRRGGGKKKEWEWRSPIWTHLTKGQRKALRKVVE